MLPHLSNPALEDTAFTHRSALNENPNVNISNERLEFLGDAVLELVASLHLFNLLPEAPEGELTSFRSSLVKTTTLARIAKKLGIGERIKMSKGEEASKGRENEAILADTMEAYLGALYLDQGYEAVEHLLLEHLFPLFDEIKTLNLQKDSKSKLQEYVQRKYKRLPVYKIIESSGPDHDRIFTVAVFIEDKERARATGKSKQDAQQEAAGKALEVLGQV